MAFEKYHGKFKPVREIPPPTALINHIGQCRFSVKATALAKSIMDQHKEAQLYYDRDSGQIGVEFCEPSRTTSKITLYRTGEAKTEVLAISLTGLMTQFGLKQEGSLKATVKAGPHDSMLAINYRDALPTKKRKSK